MQMRGPEGGCEGEIINEENEYKNGIIDMNEVEP